MKKIITTKAIASKHKKWFYSGLIVICFVIVFVTYILSITSVPHPEALSEIPENHFTEVPTPNQPVTDDISITENNTVIEIDLDKIHLNMVDSAMDTGRKYPQPEECVNLIWNDKDIIDYYGNNLIPPYIPAGLTASPNNATQNIILSTEGTVWEDTVWLDFYHAYYEDGSPKLTENIPVSKGFYLHASKIGLLNDFNFIGVPEDIQTSHIGEISVILGYQSIAHGPYDSDTHSPAGYYDRYVAQFTLNEIEYELVFSQIEFEEIIKVIASIIYNDKNIIICK